MTANLAVHYQRTLYIVESSPASLAARGQLVDVHEMLDGTVHIRHDGVDLPAAPFRKAGEVRQQDVADNKYLATILEKLRQKQIAEDERALANDRGTKREKAVYAAANVRRRATTV